MIQPVYLYGHPVLRAISKDIDKDYPDLPQLVQDLKDTMYESDGIGIAAPQIGINARVIFIDVDALADSFPELKDKRLVLINPQLEIDEESKAVSREEGCLSLPGIHENVSRHSRVRLKWLDENWQPHDEVIEGYLARVVQHEYDHLDGVLFIDRISPIRKQLIRNKLNNIVKGKVRCDYRTRGFKPAKHR